MGRAILGVIVGYIVMAGAVLGSVAAAWMVMGPDRAYKPGVWEVSTAWIIMMVVVGLIAAMIGGAVCAAIAAKGSKAAMVLAGLVFPNHAGHIADGHPARVIDAPVVRHPCSSKPHMPS